MFDSLIDGSDYKLIYRHYATLYFIFCVNSSDLIQVFVETLDKCFENVCKLDLIFHVDKVIQIFNTHWASNLSSLKKAGMKIYHYSGSRY